MVKWVKAYEVFALYKTYDSSSLAFIENLYLLWGSHLTWGTCEYFLPVWFSYFLSLDSLKPSVLWHLTRLTMTLCSVHVWKLTFLCSPEGSRKLWLVLWLVTFTTSLLKTSWKLCLHFAWWTISPWLLLISFSKRTSSMSCWHQVWRRCTMATKIRQYPGCLVIPNGVIGGADATEDSTTNDEVEGRCFKPANQPPLMTDPRYRRQG